MDWLTQLLQGLGPGAANAGAPGVPGAGTFDDRFAPAAALPPAQPIAQLPAYSNAILGPNPMNVGPAPSLGESIGGTGGPGGQPLDISTQGPGGPAAGQSTGNKLLQALRGVKAPDAPVAQRVATPHAPQQRPIGGGNDLVQLLIGLGLGPKDVVPGFRMPGR